MVTKNDVKVFEKRQRPLHFPSKNPKMIMESCRRDFNPSNVEELITKWRFISEDASEALESILELCEPLLQGASKYTKDKIPQLLQERLFPYLPKDTINSLRTGRYGLTENVAELASQLQEAAQYTYDCSRIINNRDKIRNKCGFKDFISTKKSVYQMSERIYNEYATVNVRNVYSIILENIRLETELEPDVILSEVTEFFKSNELLNDTDIIKVKEKTCLYENMDILDKYTKRSYVNEYAIGRQDLINHIDELKRNDSMSTADIDTITNKILYAPIDDIIKDITPYLQFIKKYFVFNDRIDMESIKLCISKLMERLKVNMIDRDTSRLMVEINNEQKSAAREIETTLNVQKKERTREYINLLDTIIAELKHVDDFMVDYEEVAQEHCKLSDDDNFGIIELSESVIDQIVNEVNSKISVNNGKPEESDNNGDKESGDSEEMDPEVQNQIMKVANSVKNFSKYAVANVSATAKNASAVNKKVSKTIDSTVSGAESDIKSYIHNISREKVIKGKLIPSASRSLKIAIAAGAGMAINPALTIVASLGALGVSKKITKKERQYIMDEIDIELKILDKKIQHAEMTNDTEELSNLLRLQRSLQRERQRIRYKMKDIYIPASNGGR